MIDSLIWKNILIYNNKTNKQKNEIFKSIYKKTLEIFLSHNEGVKMEQNANIRI